MAKPKPPKGLNATQIKLCNYMADPDIRTTTKTQLAKQVGITRPTLYKYMAMQEVVDYTNQLIDYYTDAEVSAVWKALLRQCKRGDTRAIKLFYEMKQMYVPPSQVVDLKMADATANINIISHIPRPVDEDKKED